MPIIDAQRLREFTATLQQYKAGKASLERRVVAAENWWKLRNRFEEQKRGGGGSGFTSESGWLHNVIVSKHADAMEAYPEPVILPREPGDADLAETLSAILPCILDQNRFEQVYSQAMWQKLKTGTACYRVVWDSERLHGLGDIAIERVDLLNLFWEPGISDIQQSRYLFCTHLEDEDSLAEQYPQLRGRLRSNPFLATRFVYDDAVSLAGKATVIEVYYKKKGVLHYCKYVGDTVLYATENEAEMRDAEGRVPYEAVGEGLAPPADTAAETAGGASPAPTTAHSDSVSPQRFPGTARRGAPAFPLRGRWHGASPASAVTDEVETVHDASACPGAPGTPHQSSGLRETPDDSFPSRGSLDPSPAPRGLYAHGKYPFVLDPLFPVEGSPCGYGFVDLCANTQTAIDLLRGAFVTNAVVGATPRYFQRLDGAVNEEEFLDLSRPLVHVSGNLGEDSLRQIGFLGLPGIYVNVLESTIRELRETSGNTETATGTVHSGVTAASAIAALQEASGKGSRDATRQSYLAFGEIVELCIELIREFYSLPRQFRIMGAAGARFVSFSNAALQPRALPLLGEGWLAPTFDVKVSAQKRSAYSRLSQNELAMELYRLGLFEKGRESEALGLLELMEFDGKDALRERLLSSLAGRGQLQELERYRSLALALAARYRPDLAEGLMEKEGVPVGEGLAPPADTGEGTAGGASPAPTDTAARIRSAEAVLP